MYYVYRFLDKSKNIIYVGKSKQELEKRFMGHKHLPDECYSSVYKIEYISCIAETDMNIKEIYYINKFKSEKGYFNLLDLSDMPQNIEFDDKWKLYKGALPPRFSKSINYKKRYSSEKKVNYNKDGSIDKRKPNSIQGESNYVEALSKKEVALIVDYLITRINTAPNTEKRIIWFRNLTFFVISVNLPLKPEEILNLKYKDVFEPKDKIKSFEFNLGRFHKDKIIYIPLRMTVKNILNEYCRLVDMNYEKDSEQFLFKSRKGEKPISLRGLWGIVKDCAVEVGVKKNIGTQSLRKTYGMNIYKYANNKLKAIQFLGEIWGQQRESQIIKFLDLVKTEPDFEYFFGETFALADVDFSKIEFINTKTIISNKATISNSTKAIKTQSDISKEQTKETVSSQEKTISSSKKKSQTQIEKKIKLEIVNEYLSGNITQKELSKKYSITVTTINRWVHDYVCYGEKAFK